MTAITPAPEALTSGEERLIDRFHFNKAHPYVLSDGRRFMSLECAAASAAGIPGAMVIGPDGRVYSPADCWRIAKR